MTRKQLKKDIDVAIKLLYGEALNKEEQLHYNQIYPWSNEGIDEYYNYYTLKQKRVLTITASGDHIIYATSAGAKEIDSIDINRLSKYYAALKIASIKAYTEDEFIDKFMIEINPNLFDIKPFLSENEFTFWQEIMATNKFNSNYFSFFRTDGEPKPINIDYNQTKKLLEKTKINYFDISFDKFVKQHQQGYDAIFLSNIIEWDDDRTAETYIKKALELSNPNGIIYDYFLTRYFGDGNCCDIPYETSFQCRQREHLYSGVYIYQKK